MERLRTRIASDLHDDVGTNLSSIILSSQIMEKKFSFSTEEKEYLHQLSSIASKTQDVLKETVWLLNPMNDSFADLVLRLKSIASQTLREISFSFISDENLLHEKLSLEVKRNILLMFKEILQNIIKHSRANTVKIEIRKVKDSLVLKILDDGIGFNFNEVKRGNGLTNLFFRTKAIAGKLDIDSKTGKGTEVALNLNITQMRTGRKAVAVIT
jgi:signal transduction histidine kinase